MKRKLSTLILSFFGVITHAQDAAPSSYLHFKNGFAKSDIWMNKVMIPISTPCTYDCTLGFNPGQDGGGYCGIQDSPAGKLFIFSIWDPSNQQAITADYVGEGTEISTFGGEGTGLKSMNKTHLNWELNQWYNLVIRRWTKNNHSFFGFWIYDESGNKWNHMVTMDFPMAGIYLNNNPYSFIEDWIGSGQNDRKVNFKSCWERSISGVWKHLNKASFSANDEARNGIYNEAFNSEVENETFFMHTGNGVTHAFSGRTTNLEVTSLGTNPNMPVGQFLNYSSNYFISTQHLKGAWEVDTTKSPQFAYHVKIFDSNNNLIKNIIDTIPQARNYSIDISDLPNAQYTSQFSIIDIFDQETNFQTVNFIKIHGPEVVITAPIDNENFTSPASIIVQATATDNLYSIKKVEFFSNNNLLGIDTTAPYSFAWNNVYNGKYELVAKATNNNNVISESESIMVQVNSSCNNFIATSGSSPAYQNSSNTYDKALDGNTATYFDYSQANNGVVQVDFGQGQLMYVNKISFYPRPNQQHRMNGGKFQASNDSSFTTGVVDIYTIPQTPNVQWNSIDLSPTSGYRYYRYLSPPNGWCNVAEIAFCGDNYAPSSHLDCNGVWSGTAFIDSCSICAGGNTGITPQLDTLHCNEDLAVQKQIENLFEVYPNPTSGKIFIEYSNPNEIRNINITNSQGQSIFDMKADFDTILSQGIDLNRVPKGLYFIHLKTVNREMISKIILE